jgi:hypothetical protein
MHGDKEEQETYTQLCIREEQSAKFIPYLKCFLEGNGVVDTQYNMVMEGNDPDACMKKVGVDSAKVASCISSGKGDDESVVNPSVIKDGSVYKMWYSGYDGTNSRLLLDTASTGTASIEFRKGTNTDTLTDYRLINDTGASFKLQYQNHLQIYSDVNAQIMWYDTFNIIMWKNATFDLKVGIEPRSSETTKRIVATAASFASTHAHSAATDIITSCEEYPVLFRN